MRALRAVGNWGGLPDVGRAETVNGFGKVKCSVGAMGRGKLIASKVVAINRTALEE